MMEYFNPEEVDALSLQDMIDCDIKADIDSLLQMQSSDKMSSLEYCLQQINSCDVAAAQNNNNLEYIPLSLDMSLDGKNGWGTSEAERLHQLVEVENSDPNLLVNPQTGMPVHEQMDTESNSVMHRISMNGHSQEIVGLSTTTQQMYIPVQINSISTTGGGSPLRQTGPTQSFILSGPGRESRTIQLEMGLPSPSQTNPVLLEQLQNPIGKNSPRKLHCVTSTNMSNFCRTNGNITQNGNITSTRVNEINGERVFAKPAYSYSCLIAMALKNSKNGSLPVSEIYHFMTSNFPYFKTAPDGWKNSVRHNLSLNKCFEKVENPNNTGNTRKGCLWGLNPAKVEKMEEEIVKWRKKDPESVKNSLAHPEKLELIESGLAGSPSPPQRRSSQTSEPDVVETMNHTPQVMLTSSADEMSGKPKSMADMLSVDLTGLDTCTSLSLDPVLSELASQSGLWDDDLTSELKLDIPFSSSPLTCNSPLTQPSLLSGFTSTDSNSIQGSYLYTTAPFHVIDQSPATKQITVYSQTPTRTLSAQT